MHMLQMSNLITVSWKGVLIVIIEINRSVQWQCLGAQLWDGEPVPPITLGKFPTRKFQFLPLQNGDKCIYIS